MSDQKQPIEIPAETVAPLSKVDEIILECFAKDVAAQATRLDELAKQLITLEIAIPGLYAAILKLVSNDKVIADTPKLLIPAFLCWMLSLGLCLTSLLPVKHTIDPDSLTQIRHYFSSSARRKLYLLTLACICSMGGIYLAVLSIFSSKPIPG